MAASFPNQLNFRDKIDLFLYRDGTMTMARAMIGAVLGLMIGSGVVGAPVVGLIGAGMVVLTALAHTGIERAKRQVLTDFYRDEIAASLGKPAAEVTPADLEPMGLMPHDGGKGSYAIKAAADDFTRIRNFFIVAQAATAVLMTGALFAVESFFPGLPMVALAGGASLLYNELFDTVRRGGEIVTDINKGTITRDIRAISDQIGLGGRISSTRVFSVFVKADPGLASAIKKRFGAEYDDLGITVKRELVREYDAKYKLYQATQDMNLGYINPTELGFLAYGQQSGVPRRAGALSPFKGLEDEGHMQCVKENDQVVCRSQSGAALMADETHLAPDLKDSTVPQRQPIHSEAPANPDASYNPRDLFHAEQVRASRIKDPFKTLQ